MEGKASMIYQKEAVVEMKFTWFIAIAIIVIIIVM
jgi:hypothetical protein